MAKTIYGRHVYDSENYGMHVVRSYHNLREEFWNDEALSKWDQETWDQLLFDTLTGEDKMGLAETQKAYDGGEDSANYMWRDRSPFGSTVTEWKYELRDDGYWRVRTYTEAGEEGYEEVYVTLDQIPQQSSIRDKRIKVDNGIVRQFETGATRDTGEGKVDMEGFTHPMVMEQYAKYMNMCRLQSDGNLRASDNWQKGIPKDVYAKSLRRHHDDVWKEHRGFATDMGIIGHLCAIMFNSMGYLHEILRERNWKLQDFDGSEPTPEMAQRKEQIADKEYKF